MLKKLFSRSRKPEPDSSPLPENLELSTALAAAEAHGDFEPLLERIQVLLAEARVIVPLKSPPTPQGIDLLVLTSGGEQALAGFSDPGALGRFAHFAGAEPPSVTLTFQALCRAARQLGFENIVLNPTGRWAFQVPARLIGVYAEGLRPDEAVLDTTAQDFEVAPLPRPLPPAYKEALRQRCLAAGASEVYAFEARVRGGQPNFGLAVNLPSPETVQALAQSVAAIEEESGQSPFIAVLPLADRHGAIIRERGERVL